MASNPGSRATSYTERKNNSRQTRKSGAASSTVERQTEKKKTLIRETYTIRSTSPSKRPSDAQAAPKRAREAAATNPKKEPEKEQPGMTALSIYTWLTVLQQNGARMHPSSSTPAPLSPLEYPPRRWCRPRQRASSRVRCSI
jgi:hypothetical protein